MGIFPLPLSMFKLNKRLPHAGGDIPAYRRKKFPTYVAAPRRWGYSPTSPTASDAPPGCPTQVGIFPCNRCRCTVQPRLPHAGGDIPYLVQLSSSNQLAAPRRWGYSSTGSRRSVDIPGCPTQVGIFLYGPRLHRGTCWLPHAGGDIPSKKVPPQTAMAAAPRRWGYSVNKEDGYPYVSGCPTQVGIFP